MKTLELLAEEDKKYLFQNYGERMPASFVRGEGSCLFDQDDNKYIDFLSGIAVSSLGYQNENLNKALHNQVDKILHTSNYFLNDEQIEAAKLISNLSFPGKTLFLNSGTEANEAALKLARKYGQTKNKLNIISFAKSFHGRTFGSMSATGNPKIKEGFGPLLEGFIQLPYNDIDAFENEINKDQTCAVILEFIQGEGGINLANKEFVQKISKLCKDNEILLIIDEVQTGIGRTGTPFVYQHYDIKPDILTLAKGLAAGLPLGAIHAQENVAEYFSPGSHGSTFGGNHLSCAAAIVVLSSISDNKFLENINKISDYTFNKLYKLKEKYSFITEVRGMGLHIGIELSFDGYSLVKKALENKLLINCTSNNVIRIMPPLVITEKEIDEGLTILDKLFSEVKI